MQDQSSGTIDQTIHIREMRSQDIKRALDCFTAHDLQESLSTLEAFYECDPKAFYVAIDQSQSKSGVKYF